MSVRLQSTHAQGSRICSLSYTAHLPLMDSPLAVEEEELQLHPDGQDSPSQLRTESASESDTDPIFRDRVFDAAWRDSMCIDDLFEEGLAAIEWPPRPLPPLLQSTPTPTQQDTHPPPSPQGQSPSAQPDDVEVGCGDMAPTAKKRTSWDLESSSESEKEEEHSIPAQAAAETTLQAAPAHQGPIQSQSEAHAPPTRLQLLRMRANKKPCNKKGISVHAAEVELAQRARSVAPSSPIC